tara:strand:+ start:364 stop:600 length:237 start_codon:yes stop_codon:yes gene_type:complete
MNPTEEREALQQSIIGLTHREAKFALKGKRDREGKPLFVSILSVDGKFIEEHLDYCAIPNRMCVHIENDKIVKASIFC